LKTKRLRRATAFAFSFFLLFLLVMFNPWFLNVANANPGPDVAVYYPSGYNLLGSTGHVSGALTDLQSDNGLYMTFRSYVSASSPSASTKAFIAYRDSTTSLNIPKERTWNGSAWSPYTEMPTSGSPVRWVRTAYSPIEQKSYEKIAVTLSDDGYLDAFVWDGNSWQVSNNIGFVNITANAYRAFDIAYERTSGLAMLVYAVYSTSATQDLAYKTWNGTAWSNEFYIDDTSQTADTQYYWVYLASKPTSGSNEIALVGIDGTNYDIVAWIWNGNSWGNMNELTPSAAITVEDDAAVAYETTSGKAIFGYGVSGANIQSKIWTGTTWNNTASTLNIDAATSNWITMKSDPVSDRIMLTSVDGSTDLNTFLWNPSSMTWTRGTGVDHDSAVDTNARRCADFEWEPTGSKGLLVWGTTTGQITYRAFTAPSTWGTIQNTAMGANVHPWVQLRGNPRDISGDAKILGAVLESGVFDIGAIKWDGTTLTVIGTNTISSDTTVVTYECFELEFQRFGEPTEFTSEVEFTGTSNMQSWAQLIWTIDSGFTALGVTATFQLYNYQAGSYPTSGDGFMTDNIGTTDVSKTQTISTNPTDFRDASGNWKLKIKGVKTTATPFDWKGDLVKYEVHWGVVGFNLNLRVRDWDLTDNVQGAEVYKDTDVKVSDNNGWANWTLVAGTVQIKVKWYGFWVNGTFSVTMDSDKTIDIRSNIFDISVTAVEGVQSALLQYANVTAYNGTSVEANKIRTGTTGADGKVTLLNLPNATLTFTTYDGASPQHVISNVTRTVTTENQAESIVCNQNYVSVTSSWSITGSYNLAILIGSSSFAVFSLIRVTCLKERIRTVRSKHKIKNEKKKGERRVKENT